MKEYEYHIEWRDGKVFVSTQDKNGQMAHLFLGPPDQAHLILSGWKTGINASGGIHWSKVQDFDWNLRR